VVCVSSDNGIEQTAGCADRRLSSRVENEALDDILSEGLKLVVCGTAAGTRSAQLKHYHSGPGNKFWRTLAALSLTPRQLSPDEAPLLLDFGISLTDLAKGQSGADSAIVFDPGGAELLRDKVRDLKPQVLGFNGKRAAQEFFGRRTVSYGLQPDRIGETEIFVAPSTSAAANGSWDLSWWRDLAERVHRSSVTVGARTQPPQRASSTSCSHRTVWHHGRTSRR